MTHATPPTAPAMPAERPEEGGIGLEVTSLVLGILGFCIPLVGLVAIILGVIALARGRTRGKGLAIGGIVTGALALVLGIGFIVFVQFVAYQTTTELENFNTDQFLDENLNSDELFPELNSDPPDGTCDPDRFIQDPDC